MIMLGGAAGGGGGDEAAKIPAELSAVQDYNLPPFFLFFFNSPICASLSARPRGLSDTVKQPTAGNERDNSAEGKLH